MFGLLPFYKAENRPKGKCQASGVLFQMPATSAEKSTAINVSWLPRFYKPTQVSSAKCLDLKTKPLLELTVVTFTEH